MNPILQQIREGIAPSNIRIFAAQGLLPITEDELISVQIFLTKDPDETIAKTALSSLLKVPEVTWFRLVEKKNPDPEIILFCLEQKSLPDNVKERILLNHSIPDETICKAAAMETGALLDLIISNQVRLMRAPEILAALEGNTTLTADQKRRIDEFKTEFVFKKRESPAADQLQSFSFEDILAQIPDLDLEAQRMLREADSSSPEEPSEEQIQQTIRNIFSVEDLNQIPEDVLNTYQRIMKMKHGEKLRVALLGSKEERAILIRDYNKQVGSMVLKRPKLTDPEIENFAQMRNLDSDLLRQLGMTREFLKRYTVVHTLVRNPKTPSAVSLNLLKLLREMDLRNLARDKEIPEIIRRQAKKLYDLKNVGK